MERLIKVKTGFVNMSTVSVATYFPNLKALDLYSINGVKVAALVDDDAEQAAQQINRLFRLGQANIQMLEDEHREENRLGEE